MSTVQAGDQIAVYRGSTLYHAPADMSTLQDTDLIVVGRGNTSYKCTVADWKASQGRPPAIYDLTVADSPQAGRFTSGTFETTVNYAEVGTPTSTLQVKAWVEAVFSASAGTAVIVSDEIIAISGTNTPGTVGTFGTVQMSHDKTIPTTDNNYGKRAQDAATSTGPGKWPAYEWAKGLTLNGHNDWYIGSFQEYDVIYQAFKPGTRPNDVSTGATSPWAPGVNSIAVPRRWTGHTTTTPAQTTIAPFILGAEESFKEHFYWCASAGKGGSLMPFSFRDGGTTITAGADNLFAARAIRRVPYTGSEPPLGSPYEGGYFGGLVSMAESGVADYALIIAPNQGGSFGYTGGAPGDPYVLTLKSAKDLEDFPGEAVTQSNGGAAGTVSAVNLAARTMTLQIGATGTWGPPNTGLVVRGPAKPIKTRMYCKLNAGLNVLDLQSADPGYTTASGGSPFTLTFPAVFPSGNPPDTDIASGGHLVVEAKAANSGGSSVKNATIIPV